MNSTYDSAVITLKKGVQTADYGTALRHTLCPQCKRFMTFRAIVDILGRREEGTLEASCCGRKYHMYMETVTIQRVEGARPPSTKARHHSYITTCN